MSHQGFQPRGHGRGASGPYPGRGRGGPPFDTRGGPSRGRGGRGGGPMAPVVTSRTPIPVLSNTFALRSLPKNNYFQYQVAIQPEPRTPKKARIIFHELQVMSSEFHALFKEEGVFDGRNIFFSSSDLTQDGSSKEFPVKVPIGPQGQRGGDFIVTLTRVAVVRPLQPTEVLSTGELAATSVNLLQMIVQEHARRRAAYFLAKRSLFFPGPSHQSSSPIPLSGGVTLVRGFFQAVKPVQGQVVVNIDAASTLMYSNDLLHHWAVAFFNDRGSHGSDPRALENIRPDLWRELRRALLNVRVSYWSGKMHERRIRGLVTRAGRVEFDHNSKRITVQEYFQSLNIPINYPDSFGVYLDDEKKRVVPAELCRIIPGQRYMKQLSKKQQADAVQHLTLTPRQRMREIREAQKFFSHDDSLFLLHANMKVSSNLMQISGIQLPTPVVHYRDGRQTAVANGQWKIDNSFQFREPIGLATWAVVNFAGPREEMKIVGFVNRVRECCQNRGMGMPPAISAADVVDLRDFNESTLAEGVLRRLDANRTCAILFFLPEGGSSDLHKRVKYWGDVQTGVTTQCLMVNKIQEKDLHNNLFGNNIALKLNAKLGGVNSIAKEPKLKRFLSVPSMVIGADVAHPGPGVFTRPSFASIVTSYNESWTKYTSYMDVQPPRFEFIEKLDEMMELAFDDFGAMHKALPREIFYYRDGLSEGQYDGIATAEMEAIKRAWDITVKTKNVPNPPPFRLTFIIVEKRHHIRFLPQVADEDQSRLNVPPGLLVSQDVVARRYENFYLVSQAGILGTSRPTHYIIRYKPSDVSVEECQDVSFFLCHVNARTTRSAALPAPVHYADLLCAEGLNYIKPTSAVLQSDTATTTSDGDPTFDIDAWRKELPNKRVVNRRIFRNLFFV